MTVAPTTFVRSVPDVALLVESRTSGIVESLPMGALQIGTHDYVADTTSCLAGCRVAGITVTVDYYTANNLTITFQSLARAAAEAGADHHVRRADGVA